MNNKELQEAYYYFDFSRIVPYEDVNNKKKSLLKKFKNDEALKNKINTHFDIIKSHFDAKEKKNKRILSDPFDPKPEWKSFRDDLPDSSSTKATIGSKHNSVQIKVYDAINRKVIENVRISLWLDGSDKVGEKSSGPAGGCSFKDVLFGKYSVEGIAEGYEFYSKEDVIIDKYNDSIFIFMKPKDKSGKPEGESGGIVKGGSTGEGPDKPEGESGGIVKGGSTGEGPDKPKESPGKVIKFGNVIVSVIDEDDEQLISGASVYLFSKDSDEKYEGMTSDGKCTLEKVPWGKYAVEVHMEGYENYSDNVVIDDDNDELSISIKSKTSKVSISVVDEDSSEPIDEVKVVLINVENADEFTNVTDNEGICIISNVPHGEYDVVATCEGYHSGLTEIVVKDEDVNLKISLEVIKIIDNEKPKTKIYLNGELKGYCADPVNFTQEMREKRRNNEISHEMNITYYEDNNEIYIFNDPGRARRPLIIVKEGIPLLREEHLNKIANGKLKWDDLINNGLIEYLDAEEEENSYIAMTLADLTEDHTHLEIDPATMLGICAGIIPFSDHNSSPRNTMEAGMTKQALGLYVSNYALRTDTRAHLLHHPQTPIVKTRIIDSTNYDLRPSGQNFVVALMSYEGYNMEDAMVINKAALERGLARSSFFRAYDTSEKRYAGGQVDRFEVPDKNIKGYRSENAYRNLDDDGVVNPESYVESGDVLIGKTSPPRFLEEDFGSVADRRRETSVTVRHGEKGIVDAVLLSETVEGSRLAKIRVRDTRQPEFGDKFASRHGQKGVVGLILSPEDIPFTEFGVVPDLIVNPHAIPSRMSIGQVLEMVAGKAGCLEGERVDATPFNQTLEGEIQQLLVDNGFESAGCESLYSGVTGERIDAEIFVGVAYYQKLHHMTTDKVYARSRGPVQVLTRQPTEGRAREGGLRFGEMERDCLIAHGAALTLKERLLDESDKYEAIVCENCGMLAVYDKNKNKKYCPICGDVETYPVEISYAFKLLLDELKSLCIFPKLILGDKA